jgi:hypothetical protein
MTQTKIERCTVELALEPEQFTGPCELTPTRFHLRVTIPETKQSYELKGEIVRSIPDMLLPKPYGVDMVDLVRAVKHGLAHEHYLASRVVELEREVLELRRKLGDVRELSADQVVRPTIVVSPHSSLATPDTEG